MTKEYNWKPLMFGKYLVRTQAGFKQALKDYDPYDELSRDTHRGFDYPKAYPCVITLGVSYQGADYLQVSCITVTSYILWLSRALEEVINE